MGETYHVFCKCDRVMRFGMTVVSKNKIGNLVICDHCGRMAFYLYPMEVIFEDFQKGDSDEIIERTRYY